MPSPALSVSDYRSKEKTAIVPPVNEIGGAVAQGDLNGQKANNSPSETHNRSAGDEQKSHSGSTSAGKPQAEGQHGNGADAEHSAPWQASNANSSQMGQGSATLISVAKDGHFGAVIVGTSLQDRFPEIQGVWGQRVIYTVYLHVGLRHSWILQYSLSPAMEASGGNIGRLEAPWPYTIVRPELAWEDTGAVIVSGLVDQSGRFENLKIIVPDSFSLSEFVLQCLRQWQFRPAAQSGYVIPVEIMLIIPDS